MKAPHHTLRAANRARQAEWDKDSQISLSYRGNELAGETGEACNIIKKIDRERMGIAGSRATVAQLAEELADVVICADLIAMDEGIDLDRAVAAKFNATSVKVGLATRMASSAARTWAPGQPLHVVQSSEPGHWTLDYPPDAVVFFAGWTWSRERQDLDLTIADRWPPRHGGDLTDGWSEEHLRPAGEVS